MTTINVYLTFEGNCKEAFEFYSTVFGSELQLSTFGEMPPQEGMPPLTDEMKQRIMHVSLPISKETVLMGSDTGGGWAPDLKIGNNFSISINADSTTGADSYFNKLAEGGQITMPMDTMFWGDYFGMVTDKFGINWMVSFPTSQEKP